MSDSIAAADSVETLDAVALETSLGGEGSIGGNAPAGDEFTSMTVIGSIDELKRKAPKLYHAMLMGIGMSIVNDMQHQQDRLKAMHKEYERNS